MYRIDNWNNQGSGWIVEEIRSQYLNVSSYHPLIGSTYIELPNESKHSIKDLINLQNDDNKCFLWCHIRHLNSIDENLQRITKKDKEFISKVNYDGINFPVSKKDYCKVELKNNICINVFCYENKIVYLVFLLSQKFRDSIDLLILNLIMCILKILADLCLIKQNIKVKDTFISLVYNALVVKEY